MVPLPRDTSSSTIFSASLVTTAALSRNPLLMAVQWPSALARTKAYSSDWTVTE